MNPDQPNPQEPPFPVEPVPPELLEWARQNTTEEEFLAHLREMEANGGGIELKDFIHELEAIAIGESPGEAATADVPCFVRVPG